METDSKRIRRELERRGYSEQAVVEIFKWYQPSKQHRAVRQKNKREEFAGEICKLTLKPA